MISCQRSLQKLKRLGSLFSKLLLGRPCRRRCLDERSLCDYALFTDLRERSLQQIQPPCLVNEPHVLYHLCAGTIAPGHTADWLAGWLAD